MNKRVKVYILALYLFQISTQAVEKANYFAKKSSADQELGINYIRISTSIQLNLFGNNSLIQCLEICQHQDTCRSVYVKEGACVFGFNDTTEFEGNQVFEHPDNQIFYTKGLNTCTL